MGFCFNQCSHNRVRRVNFYILIIIYLCQYSTIIGHHPPEELLHHPPSCLWLSICNVHPLEFLRSTNPISSSSVLMCEGYTGMQQDTGRQSVSDSVHRIPSITSVCPPSNSSSSDNTRRVCYQCLPKGAADSIVNCHIVQLPLSLDMELLNWQPHTHTHSLWLSICSSPCQQYCHSAYAKSN